MLYLLHVATIAGIYCILALSFGFLAGQAGLLSLAHAAFFGIGGYIAALLSTCYGLPLGTCIVGAFVGAGVLSVLASAPSLRLSQDYLMLATLGFQMLLSAVFINWTVVTNGPLGITQIPLPTVFGHTIASQGGYLVVVVATVCATVIVLGRLSDSPYGRVLRLVREDQVLAQAAGKSVAYFKVTAFCVSCGIAGVAGALYCFYVRFVDPTSFSIGDSIQILAMAMIGGPRRRLGAIAGVIVIVSLPELLRVIGLSSAAAANIRQIAYGAALVLFMLLRPRGLVRDSAEEASI